MKNKDNDYWQGICHGAGVVLIIGVMCFVLYIFNSPGSLLKIEVVDNVSKCYDNNSIQKTSECVIDYVRETFTLNESNIGKELTFEEFKLEGGVCTHFSDYYEKVGIEFGYYTEITNFIIW